MGRREKMFFWGERGLLLFISGKEDGRLAGCWERTNSSRIDDTSINQPTNRVRSEEGILKHRTKKIVKSTFLLGLPICSRIRIFRAFVLVSR